MPSTIWKFLSMYAAIPSEHLHFSHLNTCTLNPGVATGLTEKGKGEEGSEKLQIIIEMKG